MLAGIFGNHTAEKVLLQIEEKGEIHASAIAEALGGVALDPIKKQLQRFERAGVLKSRVIGKARLFSWNPVSRLVPALQEILVVTYGLRARVVATTATKPPAPKSVPAPKPTPAAPRDDFFLID